MDIHTAGGRKELDVHTAGDRMEFILWKGIQPSRPYVAAAGVILILALQYDVEQSKVNDGMPRKKKVSPASAFSLLASCIRPEIVIPASGSVQWYCCSRTSPALSNANFVPYWSKRMMIM